MKAAKKKHPDTLARDKTEASIRQMFKSAASNARQLAADIDEKLREAESLEDLADCDDLLTTAESIREELADCGAQEYPNDPEEAS